MKLPAIIELAGFAVRQYWAGGWHAKPEKNSFQHNSFLADGRAGFGRIIGQ